MEQDIDTLILKKLNRTISESENELLEKWKNESEPNRQRFEELTNLVLLKRKTIRWENAGGDAEATWASIEQQLLKPGPAPIKRISDFRVYWKIAAAVVVIVLATGLYLRMGNRTNKIEVTDPKVVVENDMQPGANKAILTLGNGSTIVLDNTRDGAIAKEGNAELIKSEGTLQYASGLSGSSESLYNTLTVPKGGKYRLLLSDGTKVWLNSASSIRYPAVFKPNERNVEINGEAYFEVAPRLLLRQPADRNDGESKKVPFIVRTSKGMQIEVLGTHFNVNAYDDELAVKTTLLEGKVKVTLPTAHDKRSRILMPGEQAVAMEEGLSIIKNGVDLEEVTAWKDGRFYFNYSDLSSVMRQIARWYDIEIVYEGKVPTFKLSGESSRNVTLASLLNVIQMSDVKCRIEGKKLIVPEQ
jgi:ferric-dicitrate binding protein FerR (iron transport regulator)